MKKSLLGLTVSALFMVGAAHATTNPNDASATLNITGTVVQDIANMCTVTLDKSTLRLSDTSIDKLITQGEDATSPEQVKLNIPAAMTVAPRWPQARWPLNLPD